MLPSKQNIFAIALLAVTYSALVAQADDLEISMSPSPVGSGARAAGMADAFVAIADDATAASWNPAGLVQLERPEFSIVGAWHSANEDFLSARHPESRSSHQSSGSELNFLSYVHPLGARLFDRNVTLSLSYQRKYNFDRAFNTSIFNGDPLRASRFSWRQSGSLSVITPAIAVEVTERISLGLAVNLWRDTPFSENGWTQRATFFQGLTFGYANALFEYDRREKYSSVSGENFTLGMLWKPNHRWSLGIRYDSPLTAEADYESRGRQRRLYTPGNVYQYNFSPALQKEKRSIHFPDTLALGVAYRKNDRLTISFDLTRTDWNDYYTRTAAGKRISLVDGSDLDNPFTGPNMDPTYTARLGVEYVFVPKRPSEELQKLWTLRAGLFFDEEPATGKQNTVLRVRTKGDGNADAFYGFTLGGGLLLYHRYNLDIAYQFRRGEAVNRDLLRGLEDFHEDVVQHRLLLSAVIYF